jgi:signal transduction protein with GAF and PtsI domain
MGYKEEPNTVSQTANALDSTSYVLTLEEISTLAKEGGKPAETLMNVVGLIARRFQTEVCSAYLLEPDRANLVLAATVGLRPQCIGTLRLSLHEGLVGLVAEQVLPVAVERVHTHPRFKYFPESGEDAYQSFLGVPLIDRGVLQGVLVVQTIEARAFREEEVRMLTEAASQVAPVVSEARTLDRFIAQHRSGYGHSPEIYGGAGITIRPASSVISILCAGSNSITTRWLCSQKFRWNGSSNAPLK